MSKGGTLSQRFVIVDNHVLNILSGMNSDILVTSTFECCHVLSVLLVRFDGLQDANPFDESIGIDVTSLKL